MVVDLDELVADGDHMFRCPGNSVSVVAMHGGRRSVDVSTGSVVRALLKLLSC